MKKNLLLIALSITVASLHAQAPLNYQSSILAGNDLIRDAKNPDMSLLPTKSSIQDGERALTYYWVNFSDAVDYSLNGWTLENIAALPLWPDSTAYVVSGTGDDFFWYGHGYAHNFDPISDYISDFVNDNYTVIGSAKDWFNEDHSFVIDSARFYYYYDRYNTGYTDTLKVYLMAPNSSVYQEGYYLDNNANGDYDEGIDISLFLDKYNYTENRPSGTYTEMTFLLGDADTASFDVAYKTIPIGMTINKNSPDHFVGMAWQFIPGQPYSYGDTLLDFNDPPDVIANPLNTFWLLTNEELTESDPVSWAEYSDNQDGFASTEVRYNISGGGWNGFYISTYAYVEAFAFEHAYVDWLVAPRGVNFIASDPSPCVSLQKNFSDFSNFAMDPDAASYYWEFGDGGISTERNTSHTYSIPGTYSVCLTVSADGSTYDYCKNVVADYCNAIEEIEDLTTFSMFPNPADDVLNLSLTFSEPQNATISIVNMAGQVMYTVETGVRADFSTSIDISKLPAGVYMTRISSGNRATVKNFVVQ
ncbi:MAG: T9SS type A sorting domain-containing protein [Chitinophagales bacterium]